MSRIPQTIFQTSISPQPDYVVDLIKKQCPGWQYKFFDDDAIVDFFNDNPCDEFPNVEEVFWRFSYGATRADVFRYYYLYLNGGFFLDSDAIIRSPISDIIGSYEFVSVKSYHRHRNLVFNGFLLSTKGNPIIKKALEHMYSCTAEDFIDDYFTTCAHLYKLVKADETPLCKLYEETPPKFYQYSVKTKLKGGGTLLQHYRFCKRIPKTNNSIGAVLNNSSWFLQNFLLMVKNTCSIALRRLQRQFGRK